jgi:phenylpropionate dioxygenase-like ring-hydroxylating dioxygenase large terminal subunit
VALLPDLEVIARIHRHVDEGTTDVAADTWGEPVEHYRSADRLRRELAVMRRRPTPLCPSAALPAPGDYLAREVAGTPVLAARGRDGRVRAFRNACRHRGVRLAAECGHATAFVCPYHGWTYGLDGALRHIPHRHGFPEVDTARLGLAPVHAEERAGLVFLTQEAPALTEPELDELPELLAPSLRLYRTTEQDIPANWKILADGFLEGYHLRTTHRESFYPIQFDNLNVIEHFGRNNRVTFPYRRIGKLRDVPPEQRVADGVLTYVYHLFPNVMLATFPFNVALVVLEPLTVDRTRLINYVLADAEAFDGEGEARLKQALEFQFDGQTEDNAMARAAQAGLASGANEVFRFGRFEGALTHFHRALTEAVDGLG